MTSATERDRCPMADAWAKGRPQTLPAGDRLDAPPVAPAEHTAAEYGRRRAVAFCQTF